MGEFHDLEEKVSASTMRRNLLGPDSHNRKRFIEWKLAKGTNLAAAKAAVEKRCNKSRMTGLEALWRGNGLVGTIYGPVKGNGPSDVDFLFDDFDVELISSDEKCDPSNCWHRIHHTGERWDNERKIWMKT